MIMMVECLGTQSILRQQPYQMNETILQWRILNFPLLSFAKASRSEINSSVYRVFFVIQINPSQQ